jgi:CBS domain-containing protein
MGVDMASPLVVRELMSTDVVTLERNESLDIADRVMTLGRIRHMPVVDDQGKLCGIVSQRDLFRGALANAIGFGRVAQDRLLRNLVVKEVMATDVRTTRADTPVTEAAAVMLRHKIGCLPVVDADNRLVGILTEADFVRHVAGA